MSKSLFTKFYLKFGKDGIVELTDFEVKLIKEINDKYYNKPIEDVIEKGTLFGKIFGKVIARLGEAVLGKDDHLYWFQEQINEIESFKEFLEFHYRQATSTPVSSGADKLLRYLFSLGQQTGPTYGSFETVIKEASTKKSLFEDKIKMLRKHLDSSSDLITKLEKLIKEFKLTIDKVIIFEKSRIPELN